MFDIEHDKLYQLHGGCSPTSCPVCCWGGMCQSFWRDEILVSIPCSLCPLSPLSSIPLSPSNPSLPSFTLSFPLAPFPSLLPPPLPSCPSSPSCPLPFPHAPPLPSCPSPSSFLLPSCPLPFLLPLLISSQRWSAMWWKWWRSSPVDLLHEVTDQTGRVTLGKRYTPPGVVVNITELLACK